MASLPIILCGKAAAVVLPAAKKYLPEVDVVHICFTAESAKTEIPALLRGDAVVPVSGYGSNVERSAAERRVPVAVIAGGAFTPEEFEEIRKEDVTSVPWLKVEIANVPPSERPPNPNYPAYAAAKAKACFREHGIMDGTVKAEHAGVVWEV